METVLKDISSATYKGAELSRTAEATASQSRLVCKYMWVERKVTNSTGSWATTLLLLFQQDC